MASAPVFSTTAIPSSLHRGLLFHQNGKLRQAEECYRAALAAAPEDAETMLLLGVAAREQGLLADALVWTRRAVLARPKHAYFHLNLGLAYLAVPDLDGAERCLEEAVMLDPDSVMAWCRMAELASRRGHTQRARDCYQTALHLDPRCWRLYLDDARRHETQGRPELAANVLATAAKAFAADPDFLLAAAERSAGMGCHDRAADYCAKAVLYAPDSVAIRVVWATALNLQGKSLESFVQYEHALRLRPNDPQILHWLGVICYQLGLGEDAARCFRRAVDVQPENAELWHALGRTYAELRRSEEALPCLQRAIALAPGDHTTWNLLGNVLVARYQEDAERCYQQALTLKPDFAEAIVNLGVVAMLRGRLEETIGYYRQGLELEPNLAGASYNLSIAYLKSGRYAEAWNLYESRWRFSELRLSQRHTAKPLWNGESIAGKTILLHAEQGLGDSIQFLRYVPQVAALGARVLLEVPEALRRIAQSVPGHEGVFMQGEALPDFDRQCPLMSLIRAFQTTVDTIPQTFPYLFAAPGAVQETRLAFPGSGLRIGIVWAGNPTFGNDFNRSMPLQELLPLAALPGVSLFSLQKGRGSEELEAVQLPGGSSIVDAGSSFQDFADTAALMETLDLIITVDTSCAHLAAALGKQVWVLLPYLADWRWLEQNGQNVWYPSARLFRQQARGDWSGVVGAVTTALQAELKQSPEAFSRPA